MNPMKRIIRTIWATTLMTTLSSAFAVPSGGASWDCLNPGGGGQVQEVRPDPTVPNRLYLCSDMEGGYRSHDGGLSWEFITEGVPHGMQLMLAAEPGDTGRLYSGSMAGLHLSDDHGKTWREVPEMAGVSVATIGINPNDVNELYVGHSWRGKGGRFGQEVATSGRRDVWISKDRGKSWKAVQYESQDGQRQIETILVDPSDGKTVYLSAQAGVYVSRNAGVTWNKLRDSSSNSTPARGGNFGRGSGEGIVAYGIALSRDGKVLYVRDDQAKVYCARVGEWEWIDISAGLHPSRAGCGSAIEVDPQSSERQHRLLVGGARRPDGLWEAVIDWDSQGKPAKVSWQQVLVGAGPGNSKSTIVEEGWLKGQGVFCRYFTYAPLAWNMGRKLWAVGGQTVFYADADSPDYPNNWYERYSKPVIHEDGSKAYTMRGFHSTYNRDVAISGEYLITTCADNGAYESYDGGVSWSWVRLPLANANTLATDCWAAEVATHDHPIVIAGLGYGFGGSAGGGWLYAKRLVTTDSKDKWIHLGGGPHSLNGLPNTTYSEIKVHPLNPNRVFVVCREGLYVIEDLDGLLDGKASEANFVKAGASSIALDPFDPNTVFVSVGGDIRTRRRGGAANDASGLFKGVLSDGAWNWNRLGGATNELVVSRCREQLIITTVTDDLIQLSADQGQTWRQIFHAAQATSLRRTPWYREGDPLSIGAISAEGRWIFVHVWSENKKGYGVFAGEIQLDGSVRWQDFTDNFFYPRAFRSKIIHHEKRTFLFVTTMGTGLWRRDITDTVARE